MDHTENLIYLEVVEEQKNRYQFWKRFMDLVLSILAMIPLLVISVPVSIAILIEDGYPIF